MTNEILTTTDHELINEWFNKQFHGMTLEKLKHDTNTLDEFSKNLYGELAIGKMDMISNLMDGLVKTHYHKELTVKFFTLISESKIDLNKLAISFTKNSLLFWAEINDNDEKAEDALILIKAKLNQQFINQGFRVSSTIVESYMNFPLPIDYTEIK